MKRAILIGLGVVAVLIGLRYLINVINTPSEIAVKTAQTESQKDDSVVKDGGGWQASPEPAPKTTAEKSSDAQELDAEAQKLIEEYGFSADKIMALRAAKDGDPRTPPIDGKARRTLPTPEQLADPELYRQYEEFEEKKFFAGFVKSVQPKIDQINAHMEEMEKFEFPERDKYRAIADEKIQALEEMKAKLLEEHPELEEIETPLLDLSQFETK